MSMVRDPLFRVGNPLHNRIPQAGTAFWYRLRDSVETRGIAGIPPLVKTVTGGSPSVNEYADPKFYELPTDNGNAVTVKFIAEENEDDLFLDRVLTMVGMQAGEQIIVAQDLAFFDQTSTSATMWSWGSNGSASRYGVWITTGEIPEFTHRPRNGSAFVKTFVHDGGNVFADFKNVGRFSVVTSIVVLDATHVDVKLLLGNGTLSGAYHYDNIDVLADGTENPGISGGVSMSNFCGLSVGSGGAAGGANTFYWGRGGSNIGRLDQIVGWRGAHDASLAAAVLSDLATHSLDFPPSLCAASGL